jgi:FkbM family methyltransferase
MMETHIEKINNFYMPSNGIRKLMPEWQNQPRQISSYTRNQKVCIEAGGYIGHYTSIYSDIFDTVYSFEPDPLNFYCLNKNVQNDNVIKMQCCLGDSHGLVGITLPVKHRNKEVVRTGMYYVTDNGVIPTILIDDLKLEACDLIQLDIEGYEIHALKGALSTIEKFRPTICLEINKSLKNFNYSKKDVYNFLHSLNYIETDFINEDVIFQPKEFV